MRINAKLLILLNLIATVLLALPLFHLDLLHENYSTLTLKAEGYFYLHFLAVFIGLLLGYENYCLKGKKRAFTIFLALYLGTIIPHHYPYDLQGDLHLLFAYCGGFVLIAVSYLNLYELGSLSQQRLFILMMFLAFCIYIRYMQVNVLSEFIIIVSCLLFNLLLCKRKGDQIA